MRRWILFRGQAAVLAVMVSISLLVSQVPSGMARAATDQREMQAREAYAAGRYQEALDIFVKLYAEKLHPNYLRNIGRCYQNLGEPDKAISSFREYLRKAKSVRADERDEINGYIKEMEDLKRQREAAAATPPPKPEPKPEIRANTPADTGGGASATATAGGKSNLLMAPEPATTGHTDAMLKQTSEPQPAAESEPVYTRWWFWTLIGGAVVGGGVAVAAALGAFSNSKDAGCVSTRCAGP